jgi:aminopeptidase
MPLDDAYLEEMTSSSVADLNNLGLGRSGGACSAAVFLKQFVSGIENTIPNVSGNPELDDAAVEQPENEEKIAWAHIDIAGGMCSDYKLSIYRAVSITLTHFQPSYGFQAQ